MVKMSIKNNEKKSEKTSKIDFTFCNQSSFSNMKFLQKKRINVKNDNKKIDMKTKKKR